MYLTKNINLKSLVLILALTLSSTFAQPFRDVRPEIVGMSSERLERLTYQFDSYVNDKKLSGGVALVLRQGKAAYYYSFGEQLYSLIFPSAKVIVRPHRSASSVS